MTPPEPTAQWFDRRGIWILVLGLLAPLLWCQGDFRTLFWFGDDWDLIDQMDRNGLWTWTWETFAENFVPLFKLLWGAMLRLGGGSYFWMVCCLWLTHALNGYLLVRLLREAGVGVWATAIAVVLFGLSSGNIESLGWAVQWSSLLSSTFLLAAAHAYLRAARVSAGGIRAAAGPALWAAASALSFSRGVVTGAALAGVALLPLRNGPAWTARLRQAVLCLAPALAVGVTIFLSARGNHERLTEHLTEAATFGIWNYGLNPLHHLVAVDSFGWRTAVLLGVAKVALTAWAIRRSEPPLRQLLWLLVLVDLGNSVLLGVGRYHTGLGAVLSSRYQYSALITTAPFLGLGLEALLTGAGRRWGWAARPAIPAILVVACAWFVARGWPREAASWSGYRGRETRVLLFANPNPPAEGAVPGIEFLKTQRAKELVERYGLD